MHFWDFFSGDYLKNGCSVGLFDTEDHLVGVSVAKDFTYCV